MAVFDQTGPGIRGTRYQVRVLQTLPGQTYCRKTLLPVLDNSHDDEFQRKRLSKRQGTEEEERVEVALEFWVRFGFVYSLDCNCWPQFGPGLVWGLSV